jgi:hypothetical protein
VFLRYFGPLFQVSPYQWQDGLRWNDDAYALCEKLYRDFLKEPIDTIPYSSEAGLSGIRELYLSSEWHWVYDFIEWLSQFADES